MKSPDGALLGETYPALTARWQAAITGLAPVFLREFGSSPGCSACDELLTAA